MKVLVTGGTGFVGAAVVRAVLAKGDACRVLARPTSDRQNIEGLDVEVAEGDLMDPSSLATATAGCDRLYHVAADYRLWAPNAEEMISTNLTGTQNMLRAAADAGIGRIVYTSSVAALGGSADGQPINEAVETDVAGMVGTYKKSKWLAEQAVLEMVRDDKLPVIIVNPAAPVGERDIKPTPTGRMVVQAALGQIPAYMDTGLNIVHVDDVADGHLMAMAKGEIGRRYILGGDNMSLREILLTISEITGGRRPVMKIPFAAIIPIAYLAEGFARLFRTGEPFVTIDAVRMARKHMYFSSDRAIQELGYNPRPAVDALRDAIAWFRQHGYLGS